MRTATLPICVIAVLLSAAVGDSASGSQMVGVNTRHDVRIQEYWEGGEPYYWIHNARAESIEVVLVEQWAKPTQPRARTEGTEQVFIVGYREYELGDTLGRWHVAANGFAFGPAGDLPHEYCEFKLFANGLSLGECVNRSIPTVSSERAVATYAPLDTPGWSYHEAWFEQDQLWFESGRPFTLDLVVAAGAGEVRFDYSYEEWPERMLVVESATCPTLRISDWGGEIRIDAVPLDPVGGHHRVELVVQAPEVDAPTMYWLNGYFWSSPGRRGWSLRRGILVRPGGEGSPPPN